MNTRDDAALAGLLQQLVTAVLDWLADAEQHGGRRHQLRLFPFEMGFVDG
ncbi:hypothetical protein [Actinoplanes awajinensis]|nr:hypothetical protein [Actinoplanes awajinensis]